MGAQVGECWISDFFFTMEPLKYSPTYLEYTTDQLAPLEGEAIALSRFDTTTAWDIGCAVRSLVIEEFPEKPVVIDVTLANGQVVFHATSGPGVALDNDEWVRRKRNTVLRWGFSSFYMGAKVRSKGGDMQKALYVTEADYAAHGGCVPIRVKGSDVVLATLTISGLPQQDDHITALRVLGEFAKK